MFGCGGKTELTTLLPVEFGAFVSQIDWSTRSLILDGPDLEINARRADIVIGWTQTLH